MYYILDGIELFLRDKMYHDYYVRECPYSEDIHA